MGYLMSDTKYWKCKKTAETVLGVTLGNKKETRRHGGGMRKFRRA